MDFQNPGDFEALIESKKNLINEKIKQYYALLEEESNLMTNLLKSC